MPNTPKIRVYKDSAQGVEFINQQYFAFGNVVQSTSRSISILIINDAADSVLSILESGIALSGNGNLSALNSALISNGVYVISSATSLPVNLSYTGGLFLTVDLNTQILGSKSIILQISTNDQSNSSFYFTMNYSVVAASNTEPDISVLVGNNIIDNNSAFNTGSISQNANKIVTFQIANFGIPTLNIGVGAVSLISLGGNESFYANPTSTSSLSLAFNEFATYSVNLDSSSTGEKSFVVSVLSNSVSESPFLFTIVYKVVESYNLLVKQSNIEVFDGESINFGSVKKSSSLMKSISLSNSGLSNIIKVTNIYATGNSYLSEVPSLPFVLEPNEANKVNYNVRLETSSLGQKNSSMYIQWEVVL